MADQVVDSSESDSPVVARLQELLSGPQTTGVVYQSVIVACSRAIYRVRLREEQLARASISLGQKRKLETLLDELQQVEQILDAALTDQGRRMLDMGSIEALDTEDSRWWFALSEAIQELERSTENMVSLVGNQPRGTDVRRVAGVIVRLLHKHHAELVIEAEEWMS